MSHTGLPHDAVFYPTSDGQPMAETALHRRCMVDVADESGARTPSAWQARCAARTFSPRQDPVRLNLVVCEMIGHDGFRIRVEADGGAA